MTESRHIPTPITTEDDLPRHYPNGLGFPRIDWGYIQDVHKALRGGVFLDPGTIRNAENSRQRLIRFGMIEDATKGETEDEHD